VTQAQHSSYQLTILCLALFLANYFPLPKLYFSIPSPPLEVTQHGNLDDVVIYLLHIVNCKNLFIINKFS